MLQRMMYYTVILCLTLWVVWLQAEIADRDTVIHWLRLDLWGFRQRMLGL